MYEYGNILASRGVREVVHFHTDHFEPAGWAEKHIEHFLKTRESLPFAARASLFYLPTRHAELPDRKDARMFTVDDKFNLRMLAGSDVHVHIHHEHWTSGWRSKLEVDPVRDAALLEEYLQGVLPAFAEARVPARRWGFIHGKWALNASDPDVCYISDEISILQKHGCVADFSFPAGRNYCDPALKVPFDVKAIDCARSYDQPDAEPTPITKKARPGHFMIWSAEAPFGTLSLEHIVTDTPLATTLDAWLRLCPVIDGVLYIRTFCHTLNEEFWPAGAPTTTPFFTDEAKRVFAALEAACANESVPLRYATATEVIDALVD